MISMKLRTYIKIILVLSAIVFFIFPTSAFYGSNNRIFENSNADNSLKVVVYKMGGYNFFSLYKFLRGENYFFVIYDKCGNVTFKPSLWFGMDRSVVYGGFHFSKRNKNLLFFPTNDGIDSIELISNVSGCS